MLYASSQHAILFLNKDLLFMCHFRRYKSVFIKVTATVSLVMHMPKSATSEMIQRFERNTGNKENEQ